MPKKILLVDDEPLMLKGLKYSLEQEGYETLTAMDGEEALNVFFDNQVDLILLDVMLPKMDGIQVCCLSTFVHWGPGLLLPAPCQDLGAVVYQEPAEGSLPRPPPCPESVSRSVVSNSFQPQSSPPGSSVHQILQARILEWVAIPFSRGSSQPRDRTWVS